MLLSIWGIKLKGDVTAMKRNSRAIGFNGPTLVIILLFLIIAGGGAFGYYKYTQLNNENKRLSANPEEAAKSEANKVKSSVAQLIEVPTDEEPTIATVVDASKLSGQAFFAKAQNDDRVLMYQKAKKAILYRPSTNKIIEVAPINIGEESKDSKDTSSSDKKETGSTSVDPDATEQPALIP